MLVLESIFPREGDLFATAKIGDIPLRLPVGVERARFMAYRNIRSAARLVSFGSVAPGARFVATG
jgi:hypothetical protein